MKKEYEKPVVTEVSFRLNEEILANGTMSIEDWSLGDDRGKGDYQFPIVP